MEPNTEYPIDPFVIYSDLREKWKHEDDLINQRVTWLIQSQAFLFTAFGVLVKLRVSYCTNLFPKDRSWEKLLLNPYSLAELLLVISGLFMMYFLMIGIGAALRAMDQIKKDLKTHKEENRIWSQIRVDVLTSTSRDGASASRYMSRAFFVTWILIAVYEAARIFRIFF